MHPTPTRTTARTPHTGTPKRWVPGDTDLARLATLARWYTLPTEDFYYLTTPPTAWESDPQKHRSRLAAFRRRIQLYAGNTPPYAGRNKLIGPNHWWWCTTAGATLCNLGWEMKGTPSPTIARHAAAAARIGWCLEQAGWVCYSEREIQRGTAISGVNIDGKYHPTDPNTGARRNPDLLAYHPAQPDQMCAVEVELSVARRTGYYTEKFKEYARTPHIARTIYILPDKGALQRVKAGAEAAGYAHKLTCLRYNPDLVGRWLRTDTGAYHNLAATLELPAPPPQPTHPGTGGAAA